MESNKAKNRRWGGISLLAVFLAITFLNSGLNDSSNEVAASDSDNRNSVENNSENNSSKNYPIGFDGVQGETKVISGIEYKNFVYFQVNPDQYMEYIYRSGEVVQFFTENPNDIVWIVNEQRDSIGSTMNVTKDLSEDLGNSYYKVRFINKTATKFGAGIKQ